jgi:CheY-like chemotaxis protein
MKKPTLLIATDNAKEAEILKGQLTKDYENVFTTTRSNATVQEFEYHRPDVLVLAFNTLEKAERYYLQLYRFSSVVLTYPHRTVILCNKDEIDCVYELCKKDYFDDYILFWPITPDVTRLVMAVHHAIRDLTALNVNTSALKLAGQSRRLAVLESLVDWNVTQDSERIETVSQSIARVEQEVKVLLERFFQHLTQGGFSNLVDVKNADGLQYEIGRLQQEEIHDHFHVATESIISLKAWAEEFRQKCVPHLEYARALRSMAENVPATILVVDDDDHAQKLIRAALAKKNYELMFASSGIEALILIYKRRPDLILMDMMMPDFDGLETMLRIKSAEQFSTIPVFMVTGNSEKNVVTNCLKAGAADFLVKPFNREILLDKIRKFLY